MTNREAAEEIQKAIDLIRQDGKDWLDERDIPILEMAINALIKEAWREEHPVSPLLQKLATNLQPSKQDDLISRQAAIDEIKALYEWHDTVTEDRTIDHLKRLPSAQPETHEERTETHACDLTNSQQAINLLNGLEQSLDDYCELNDEGKAAFRMAITALELFGNSEQLPSAQPEIVRCKDCEYGKQDEYGRWYCRGLRCQVGDEDGNGFCSDAERKNNV